MPVSVLCAVEWKPPSIEEERCRRVASATLIGISIRKYCLLCAGTRVRGFVHGRALDHLTHELWAACPECRDGSWVSIEDVSTSLRAPVIVDPWLP